MRYLDNDLFNSYLIEDAMFYGKYEMPILENTVKTLPKDIVPFEKRKKIENKSEVYLHFYMNDKKLKAYLNHARRYLKEIKKFAGIISLDISIYKDLPLAEQISHSFKNKAFACFFQNNGINVIPNVRWGDNEPLIKARRAFNQRFLLTFSSCLKLCVIATYRKLIKL